jgi:hypothetical protein
MASKLELMLEAERRGILPEDKKALLTEARSRGLIPGIETETPKKPDNPALDNMNAYDAAKEYVVRPLARAGKSVLQGMVSIPELASQPLGQALDYGASKLGYNTNFGASPSAQLGNIIDQQTGGMTSPRGASERVIDAASQTLSGGGIGTLAKAGSVISKLSPKNTRELIAFGTSGAGAQLGTEVAPDSIAAPIVGGLLGGLLPGTSVSTPRNQRIVSSEDRFNQARQLYNKADEIGGVMKPEITNEIINKVQEQLPQTDAGKILGLKKDLIKTAGNFEKLRDKSLTLRDVGEIDTFLADKIEKNLDNGKLNSKGKSYFDLQSEIRDLVNNVNSDEVIGGKQGFDTFAEARKYWSNANKLSDIEKVISRSVGTQQPATSLRAGFRNLANNDKRLRGFTAEQRDLISKASQANPVVDFMGVMGSRFLPIGSLVGGGTMLDAAQSAGTAYGARKGAELAQLSRANAILEDLSRFGAPKPPLSYESIFGNLLGNKRYVAPAFAISNQQ